MACSTVPAQVLSALTQRAGSTDAASGSTDTDPAVPLALVRAPANPLNSSVNLVEQFSTSWGGPPLAPTLFRLLGAGGCFLPTAVGPKVSGSSAAAVKSSPVLTVGQRFFHSRSPSTPAGPAAASSTCCSSAFPTANTTKAAVPVCWTSTACATAAVAAAVTVCTPGSVLTWATLSAPAAYHCSTQPTRAPGHLHWAWHRHTPCNQETQQGQQ